MCSTDWINPRNKAQHREKYQGGFLRAASSFTGSPRTLGIYTKRWILKICVLVKDSDCIACIFAVLSQEIYNSYFYTEKNVWSLIMLLWSMNPRANSFWWKYLAAQQENTYVQIFSSDSPFKSRSHTMKLCKCIYFAGWWVKSLPPEFQCQ